MDKNNIFDQLESGGTTSLTLQELFPLTEISHLSIDTAESNIIDTEENNIAVTETPFFGENIKETMEVLKAIF